MQICKQYRESSKIGLKNNIFLMFLNFIALVVMR